MHLMAILEHIYRVKLESERNLIELIIEQIYRKWNSKKIASIYFYGDKFKIKVDIHVSPHADAETH